MKVCVIGTGYVGLVTGACLADSGVDVWCVDKDAEKIDKLLKGIIPIYEPGLNAVVERAVTEGRLKFTTDLNEGLKPANICFIAVNTPMEESGKADLANVMAVAEQIGSLIEDYKIVVTKSTAPVGTTYKIKDIIFDQLKKRGKTESVKYDVASNPEFLKEGTAVADFMKPDRVVVGVDKATVGEKIHNLYKPFMRKKDQYLCMSVKSSELTKYASNAMLATRISFMNSLARLCEKVDVDIMDVRIGLGSDPRIGSDFLFPSIGYGGSCLPKDTQALINIGRDNGIELDIVEAAEKVNNSQVDWFWTKVNNYFGGNLEGKHIALWGLAFKPETDDIRCSASLLIIDKLLDAGAKVSAFDSVAAENTKQLYGDKILIARNSYQCLEGADALIIATDWNEFRNPDFERIASLMKAPVIFDSRNLWDFRNIEVNGLTYFGVGRAFSEYSTGGSVNEEVI